MISHNESYVVDRMPSILEGGDFNYKRGVAKTNSYMNEQHKENEKQEPRIKKKPKYDMTGMRFGKLTVIELVSIEKYTLWHCRCDCGIEKDIYQHNLTSGNIISCGCEKRRRAKLNSEKYLHIYKGIQIEKAMAKKNQKNNTSGFRGVIKNEKSGSYRVRIIMQGVRYELGTYRNFEDAVQARLDAEKKREEIVKEFLEMNSNIMTDES